MCEMYNFQFNDCKLFQVNRKRKRFRVQNR